MPLDSLMNGVITYQIQIIFLRFTSKACLIYVCVSKFFSSLQILVLEFCILSSSFLCRLHAAALSFGLMCSHSFAAKRKTESHFFLSASSLQICITKEWALLHLFPNLWAQPNSVSKQPCIKLKHFPLLLLCHMYLTRLQPCLFKKYCKPQTTEIY